jgi:hypothetical protein
MTDSSRSFSPAQVARNIQRIVAITVAAWLAAAAFAGVLPGATVFLGLLSADPPLTLARIVLVVMLLDGLRRPPSSLRVRLRLVAIVTGALAAITLVDPHGFGTLAHGVALPEVAVTAALSAVCLATSLVEEGDLPDDVLPR